MNVLSLVFAVLLILGIFTHTQLEHFKRFSVIKKYYVEQINDKERLAFNDRQMKLYENSSESPERSGNTRGPQISNKSINAQLLFNLKEKGSMEQLQHQFIFKEFIRIHFHNAEFFKELEQRRPQFLDEMLAQLILAVEAKGSLKEGELEKLNLKDEDLHNAFYFLLKGNKDLSIKNFIHFNHSMKIKVYLAKREMLEVLFDPQTAVDIMSKRKELFKQFKKKNDEASQLFEEAFKGKRRAEIREEILDFKVTGTDPNPYD